MLEHIRRNHRLSTAVLWLCASLWLVAMLAGVQVRAPLQQGHAAGGPASVHDVCIAVLDGDDTEQAAIARALLLAAEQAQVLEEGEHGGHGSHQSPECLLCMALSPPAVVAVHVYRPPVPRHGPGWQQPAHFPPAQQATAPLPARGPPPSFHA